MKTHFIALIGAGLLAAGAAFAGADSPVVELTTDGGAVTWTIDGFDYGLAELTVQGPGGAIDKSRFGRFEEPTLAANRGREMADGLYVWELNARSYLGPELLERIAAARRDDGSGGDHAGIVRELQDSGTLRGFSFSGTFRRVDGQVLLASEGPEAQAPQPAADPSSSLTPPTKQVINGDLTVYNSLCVGFDCLSSENYGSDTVRLKENNLRVHFDDTSGGSFPANDWRIEINSSLNGGASYFAVQDATAGRTPFRVSSGAANHALFVASSSNVGFGTSTPALELHAVSGDSPGLRLEQNGSSGFGVQTWDLAGNETNLFFRDVTNGSTLPLRIRPRAPNNSIYIETGGDVGMGTDSPSAGLHIVEDQGESGNFDALRVENSEKVTIVTVAGSDRWDFSNDGNFNISKSGTGVNEFSLNGAGTLTIRGSLIALGGDGVQDPGDTFPDYVFAPEYELMSLEDLEEHVTSKRHLPNVPSAADISAAGGINMTELQLRMLEKIEELTLYTLSQERTIRELTERLETLESTDSN